MGRLSADPLALLDGVVAGSHRQGPYHHSHHDRSVLRQPSGHPRSRAGHRPPGIGHLYPTLWQRHEFESSFPYPLFEGVYLDRTAVGLKPRFLAVEPPSNTDVAEVVQKISRRVIRTLRRLGYLEAGMESPVATGYAPLRDIAPEFARTMAASVQQRIAFGNRAGQHVRRIGAGFGSEGEAPRLTGPRCASVHGFALHAVAIAVCPPSPVPPGLPAAPSISPRRAIPCSAM
jgi:hypothetical protein